MVDDWPLTIRTVAEAIIALCAAYAAYRSRANATMTERVERKLDNNPQETVAEMVKQNGGLSGQFPKCLYVPQQPKMPGE